MSFAASPGVAHIPNSLAASSLAASSLAYSLQPCLPAALLADRSLAASNLAATGLGCSLAASFAASSHVCSLQPCCQQPAALQPAALLSTGSAGPAAPGDLAGPITGRTASFDRSLLDAASSRHFLGGTFLEAVFSESGRDRTTCSGSPKHFDQGSSARADLQPLFAQGRTFRGTFLGNFIGYFLRPELVLELCLVLFKARTFWGTFKLSK